MFTKTFVAETVERAVKTFAQALVALLVADVTVLTLDWGQALAVAGTAALVSVLTSVASGVAPVGREGSPSLVEVD